MVQDRRTVLAYRTELQCDIVSLSIFEDNPPLQVRDLVAGQLDRLLDAILPAPQIYCNRAGYVVGSAELELPVTRLQMSEFVRDQSLIGLKIAAYHSVFQLKGGVPDPALADSVPDPELQGGIYRVHDQID